jgi:hypothetical protein
MGTHDSAELEPVSSNATSTAAIASRRVARRRGYLAAMMTKNEITK